MCTLYRLDNTMHFVEGCLCGYYRLDNTMHFDIFFVLVSGERRRGGGDFNCMHCILFYKHFMLLFLPVYYLVRCVYHSVCISCNEFIEYRFPIHSLLICIRMLLTS